MFPMMPAYWRLSARVWKLAEAGQIFSLEEFQSRSARLQAAMEKIGCDALLLTSPTDIFYVTGFLTRFWESPTRPWFVIVPSNRDPIAIIPSIGAEPMGRTWLSDIRLWNAPDPEDDGVTLLADTIYECVPEHGRVGLPMGLETHLRMPLSDYARLTSLIGNRSFTDATAAIQGVRAIKSEQEIARIRKSCAVADRAFARLPEFVSAGDGLDAVFRQFQAVLLSEGADWVSYLAGGAGLAGYGDVISAASRQELQMDDVLMLDTGAVCDGYFCDFDRNFAIGSAPQHSKTAYATLYAATEIALDGLKPGMRASDAHRLLHSAISSRGMRPLAGRLGHGLGISLTEWPSFTAKDHTVLEEGMVLTIEPGVEIAKGCIMVHEENIVLRADSCELLSTRASAELPVIC